MFRPTSAAAASALPPPRPAATGIFLSSATCTSRGLAGAARRAPQRVGRPPDEIRLVRGHAGALPDRNANGPRFGVNVSVSDNAIDCMIVCTS